MKIKLFVTLLLLITTRAWSMGDTFDVRSPRWPFMISSGWGFQCVSLGEGLMCDGYITSGEKINVPAVKSPLAISAGSGNFCVLTLEGVKCWGANYYGQIKVPILNSPMQVSAGGNLACALDKDGVKCWGGSDDLGENTVPKLNQPVQVSVGSGYACALDSEGVQCWSRKSWGVTRVPDLKSPTQVSAGVDSACAIDTEGVKCWGDDSYGITTPPVLNSPTQVSVGYSHACAIDADGVKCWGFNNVGQLDVPDLKSPTQISAGYSRTCALDAEGVKCWGEGYSKVFQKIAFDIADAAIPFVTPVRAAHLKSIYKPSGNLDSEFLYLKFLFVSPALYSVDSSFFSEVYLPRFIKTLEWFKKSLSYKIGTPSEVPDAEEHRKLALSTIQSALSLSLNFTTLGQQTSLQESLRIAGIAFADPMNNQKINDLVKRVDSLIAEKQALRASPKSAFLMDTLELAANWLREKVK